MKAHSLWEAPLAFLIQRKHSPIHNYIIPGLSSWLIDEPEEGVKLRMFIATRHPQEVIAPHNHRYDHRARVLIGEVVNTIWIPDGNLGDEFEKEILRYSSQTGIYVRSVGERSKWRPTAHVYGATQLPQRAYDRGGNDYREYNLSAEAVHSIKFKRNTILLLEEQPDKVNESFLLNPVELGRTCNIGATQPWMFQREATVNINS